MNTNNFLSNTGRGLYRLFNPNTGTSPLLVLTIATFAAYSHFSSNSSLSSNLTNSIQATEISTSIPRSCRDSSLQVNIYGGENTISLVSLIQYHSGSGDNVLYQSSPLDSPISDSLDALLVLGGQK